MPHYPWRILVESRKDPKHRDKLDLIAATLEAEGYHVARWRGPLSGRVQHSRRLLNCDLAILCNGTSTRYGRVLEHFQRNGIDTLFMELGWHPQSITLQLDPDGINADASWVKTPLSQQGVTPLRVRPTGDLLVLLQHEQDTQITCHSPHFPDLSSFLSHLGEHSTLPIRVRAHPKYPAGPSVHQRVTQYGMQWDRSADLKQSLQYCRAVACINSSGAVEALAERIPVLCFGHAIYRQPGAVYCLGHEGHRVAAATGELGQGRCKLFAERVDEMVARIMHHQWNQKTIPDRLPALVGNLLSRRKGPRTRGAIGWMDHMRAAPTVVTTYLYPKLQRGRRQRGGCSTQGHVTLPPT